MSGETLRFSITETGEVIIDFDNHEGDRCLDESVAFQAMAGKMGVRVAASTKTMHDKRRPEREGQISGQRIKE